jgi:hypothetical protein
MRPGPIKPILLFIVFAFEIGSCEGILVKKELSVMDEG